MENGESERLVLVLPAAESGVDPEQLVVVEVVRARDEARDGDAALGVTPKDT